MAEEIVLRVTGETQDAQAALKQIADALKSMAGDIKNLGSSSGLDKVSGAFTGLLSTVKSLGSSMTSALGGAGKTITSALLSPLNLVKRVLSPIGPAVSALGDVFKIGLGVVAGSAINTVISSLKQLAAEPVMVAARVGVLETVLETVGRTAGYGKEQLGGFVEGLKDTGISTKEALGNLTKMIQANLDLSKATDLASVAQDAAVIAGENSSETFAAMLHGITTLQPEVLRARGIIVDLQGEVKKWADAHDMATTEVDAATKQQIALNAVLQAGQAISGTYTAAMGEAGKKMGSLKRYIEEAQLALGRGLMPILSASIDIIGNVMEEAESFFISIQPTLTVFSEQVGAGLTALYEKARGVVGFLVSAFSQAQPYLQEVGDILGYYLPQVASRLKLAWGELKSAIMDLVNTVRSHVPNMSGLWTSFTDIVKGSLEGVLSLLDSFRLALKGQGEQASAAFSDAVANGLAVLIIVWEDYVSKALSWGYNIVAEFAQGMIDAASQWLSAAVSYIGDYIQSFLGAFSPPEKGVLAGIADWGQSLINTYLQSFTLADFSILDDVGSKIYSALQQAVDLGDLPEEQLIPLYDQIEELTAGLIANFRETGQISEDILGQISDALGEGGEEYVKYIQLQLEYEQALNELTALEEQYAAAEEGGFIPAALKEQLDAAQETVDAKAEELSWQEAYLAAQQDSVDLQTQQMELMESLADAMEDVASAMGDVASAMSKTTKEDPWAQFVSQYEEDMAVLEEQRRLGLISEEEYLEGVARLQERYIDQAIRMGQPYEDQLDLLRATEAQLESMGKEAGGAVTGPAITFPEIDTVTLEEDLQAGITEAFSGVSERFTEAKQKGQELLAKLTEGASEELAKLPGIVSTWIGQALDSLRERVPIVDAIVSAFEDISAWWSANGPVILAGLQTFGLILQNTVGAAIGVIVEDAWPKLQSAFDTLSATVGQFGIEWSDVWDAIGTAIGIVAAVIGALLLGIVGGVVGMVTGVASALDTFLSGWNRAVGGVQDLVEGLLAVWIGFKEVGVAILAGDLPGAWDILMATLEQGAQIFTGLWDLMAGTVEMTAGAMLSFVTGLVEGVIDFFTDLKSRLVGGSIIPDMVDEALGQFTRFKDVAMEVIDEAATWITDKIQGIADSFGNIGANIQEAIGSLGEFLGGLAEAVIPDWLMPGSATPFELGLQGIMGVIGQLGQVASEFFLFQQWRTDLEYLMGEEGLIPRFTAETVERFTEMGIGVLYQATDMSSRLVSLVLSLKTQVTQLIQSLVTSVIQLFTDLKQQVLALLEALRTEAVQQVADMVSEILAALSTLDEEVASILESVAETFESMADRMEDAISSIKDKIDELSDALDELADKAREAEKAMEDAGLMGESPSRLELSFAGANEELARLRTQMGAYLDIGQSMIPAMAGAAAGGQQTNQFFFGEGAFAGAFPGVRSGEDALGFLQELDSLIQQAAARAAMPGGIL